MKLNNIPFNITIIDPGAERFIGLLPVTALNMYDTSTGDFEPKGLYSNEIFGNQGDYKRDDAMSVIDMKVRIFHPLYFQELGRIKGLYTDIMLGKGYAKWNDEQNDFERASLLEGETGFGFFIKHFNDIVFKKSLSDQRELRINFLEKFKDRALMQRHIVIPAGIRDVEIDNDGRPVEDDINPLYRKILANANTINTNIKDETDSVLDNSRRSLQMAANAVYAHLYNFIEGKRGFLQAKVASRRVSGTTRNVISSMETSSDWLGDARQPTMDTVITGLPQFMSGTTELLMYHLRHGKFQEFFDNVFGDCPVIDKRTLRPVSITLKPKTADKWGTDEGIESLVAGFLEPHSRHKPVMIDDHYIGLIWQDEKTFRIVKSIDELPEGYSDTKLRPITYAEFFYIHCSAYIEKVRCFTTRYPITGAESIKSGIIYLKTTVVGLRRKELNSDWSETGHELLEMPSTVDKLKWMETQAIHPSTLTSYGADFDGDQLSLMPVFSDEATAEIDRLRNDPSSYLSVTGGFIRDTGTDVQEWALTNMTGIRIKK